MKNTFSRKVFFMSVTQKKTLGKDQFSKEILFIFFLEMEQIPWL